MADKILVVDDEPNLLRGLQHSLEGEGYQVVTASDGQEVIFGVGHRFGHREQDFQNERINPRLTAISGVKLDLPLEQLAQTMIIM